MTVMATGRSEQSAIVLRGRMRASQLHAGLLIRKPKPYHDYEICEWTRLARIERHGSQVGFYRTDGTAVDAIYGHPGWWSANSIFEVGQLADDDAEQEARSAAISRTRRGW